MSVFNCNIKFQKVEGDSYTSTYNKLLSQKFIDKYLNLKTDVATWRKGRSELNEQASAKLGYKVNLFAEKKLLNGIRVVPDMKLFGMLDQFKPSSNINILPVEEGINEFGDSDTNNLGSVSTNNIYQRIYKILGVKLNSPIPNDKKQLVQQQIDEYNQLNTGKVLSLQSVGSLGFSLIKTEYKVNYLYKNMSSPVEEMEVEYTPADSSSNFNLPCIK